MSTVSELINNGESVLFGRKVVLIAFLFRTITNIYSMKKISIIHPGEILLEEFLNPLKLSQYRVAKDLSVPPRRLNEIVRGQRAISADTALRLGRYFKMSPEFWMNLQSQYDLEKQHALLGKRLEREVLQSAFA